MAWWMAPASWPAAPGDQTSARRPRRTWRSASWTSESPLLVRARGPIIHPMSISRRELLRIGGAAAALAGIDPSAAWAADPAVGLIFPPLNYPIPPDAKRLYPKGVEFLSGGVGLPGGMTVEGYDEAVPRIIPAAEALAKQGARVVSVFGSSLTFYKGRAFH